MFKKLVHCSLVKSCCKRYTLAFVNMEIQAKRTTRSAAKRKLCTTSDNTDMTFTENKKIAGTKLENAEINSHSNQKCTSAKISPKKKEDFLNKDEKPSKKLHGTEQALLNVTPKAPSSSKKGKITNRVKSSALELSVDKVKEEHEEQARNDVERKKTGSQRKEQKSKKTIKLQEDNKDDTRAVKEETPQKSKKGKSKGDLQTPKAKKERSEKDLKARPPKPELEIPDIVIPTKLEKIARVDGPSPWNGTVSYTNKVYLGAHISAAGGLENAIPNALVIGGTCFALFIKNQRQWVSKPLEEETVKKFREACKKENFAPHLILPHGSYLMNCGSNDPEILKKSRATLLEEVRRCERLGILYYNIHPGSSCGKNSKEECMQNIADSINWVHHETPGSKVAIVLENMCRQGNTVGGDFAELAKIISLVADQSRIGVCLDTCHAFAAGYDLASEEGFESFLVEFERHVGFLYLVAVHLNDSEGPLGCHRDRHACIGKGHIGIEGFRRIINCPRFRDIPIVLETPYVSEEAYANEIKLLKSLAKGDTICA